MLHLDAIGRWVALATGRTLDQHAADPIPAAHLPEAAATLRHTRTELLHAVDRLRTLLINEDDLGGSVNTVLVVLPHTDSCRKQKLAGRTTRVRVGESDADLGPVLSADALRLSHADAGIYRDPAEGGLYILQSAANKPTAPGH